jgi:hypothetical protein
MDCPRGTYLDELHSTSSRSERILAGRWRSSHGGLEGVAFKLDGTCASSYTVEYQCHVQGIGDVALMTGPTFCGTRGAGKRLEAVKLTVRKK